MRRAVVIGLDGLSWNVLKELFSRGVMSNVDAFRKKGVYGELESIVPPFTVPTWASLTTGVNPGKHGAYSFLVPTEDYGSRLVSSRDVGYPRIYEVCALRGLNSVVINLPLSYPPIIHKGIMISDWLYPRYGVFPKKARNLVKDYAPLDPLWSKRDPLDYVETMLLDLKRRLNVIERLFSKTEWSLFFVVFSETDFLLHKMYDDIMSGNGLAEEAYEVLNKIDDFIGRITMNMPPDSLFLLVSDHGFTKYRYVVNVNKILRDAGLIKFRIVRRKDRSSEKMTSREKKIRVPKFLYRAVTEVAPVRRAMSLLFHALFGRKVLPFYDKALDSHSSRALMHRQTDFGIYVNSKDVFPNWLMESKEAKVVQNFVRGLLPKVKDPNTADRVFERVWAREELFQGPYVKNFPHVICLPKKEYWFSPGLDREIVRDKTEANHSLTGIFAALGGDVKHGVELNKISILDVAPSILHYLGLPVPHDADGRVLSEIFKEGSEIKKRTIRKANYLERWNIIRKAKRFL